MIVGVDNGLSGGFVAITESGDIVDKIVMPTFIVGKKTEVDIRGVDEWITGLGGVTVLAIEEPLPHAKSSQAIRSMALSFGKLLGMAESLDYNVSRIVVREWQKAILGKIPKGQTKVAALKAATGLAPDECWLANSRCRVPHDGMVDAYLIAEFYRRSKKS